MNFAQYQELFSTILKNPKNPAPYDDKLYFDYTKLNQSRLNRWIKKGEISAELKAVLSNISKSQKWVLITEPWCGDAAHSVPFIFMLSELSEFVQLEIQLRDSNSEIDDYLTNGGKSIPILVIRDENGADLAVWGPRPEKCRKVFEDLKEQNLSFEEQKIILQNWYNEDEGVSVQLEIAKILNAII